MKVNRTERDGNRKGFEWEGKGKDIGKVRERVREKECEKKERREGREKEGRRKRKVERKGKVRKNVSER